MSVTTVTVINDSIRLWKYGIQVSTLSCAPGECKLYFDLYFDKNLSKVSKGKPLLFVQCTCMFNIISVVLLRGAHTFLSHVTDPLPPKTLVKKFEVFVRIDLGG